MTKSFIIVFIGLVGSGKSTNIKLLSMWLRQRGVKTRGTILKTCFFVTNCFSKFFYKVSVQHNNFLINRITVLLDLIINTFFIIPISSLFKIKFWKNMGYTLLVEEYLPGILVDFFHLTLLYKLNRNIIKLFIKILYACLDIRKIIIILPICNYGVLQLRWAKRGSSKEHAIYLASQQKIFEIFASTTDKVFLLSTDKNIRDVFREITLTISSIMTEHD
ncbi:MAG: hypothetical protein QW076_05080 [Candidatus Anstonellales archaeon]